MAVDPDILGVIIAGGKSRRFNHNSSQQIDKFMQPFGPTTLLRHIIDRAQKQVNQLILNSNADPARLLPYGLEVIADDMPDIGPLGGIATALKFAKTKGYSHIVTFSGDSPFFPDDYVARLIKASKDSSAQGSLLQGSPIQGSPVQKEAAKITIAQSHGPPQGQSGPRDHPVMGLYDVSLQEGLAAYIHGGQRRVMQWVSTQPHKKVVWGDMSPDPFFNINSPQDLLLAETYL